MIGLVCGTMDYGGNGMRRLEEYHRGGVCKGEESSSDAISGLKSWYGGSV